MIPVGHRNSQQKNVVPVRAISAAEDEDSGQPRESIEDEDSGHPRESMVHVEAGTVF